MKSLLVYVGVPGSVSLLFEFRASEEMSDWHNIQQ